jgi:DNA-binding beta-propeller fold protein YncE
MIQVCAAVLRNRDALSMKEEEMKRQLFVLAVTLVASLSVVLFAAFPGRAQTTKPLTLIQTIDLPDVPTFPYMDHLAVDLQGHRLFAAVQGSKSVVVIDINAWKVVHNIHVEDPHTTLYRSDLDQIYVTDGDPAEPGLKIFNGRDYRLIKSLKLLARSDSAEYDPESKYFYVVNGGKEAKLDYSLLSIIDTTKGEVVGDIKIPSGSLEPMALEHSSPLLYVAIRDKDQVGVVDREKRIFLEPWRLTKGKDPSAIALDEKHHRLFVACRTSDMHGSIVVFDTQTKKEIEALPIGGKVDGLFFDATSGRLYATCGTGDIDIYRQQDPDHYVLIGKADTGIMGKTGLLVPELHLFFSSVPCIGTQSAKILVFKVQ